MNYDSFKKVQKDFPNATTNFLENLVLFGYDKDSLSKMISSSDSSHMVDIFNASNVYINSKEKSYLEEEKIKAENNSNMKNLFSFILQVILEVSSNGCKYIQITKKRIESNDEFGNYYYKDFKENEEKYLDLIQAVDNSVFLNNLHSKNIITFINVFEYLGYDVIKQEDYTDSFARYGSTNGSKICSPDYIYTIFWREEN